jgi:hypothetical protein
MEDMTVFVDGRVTRTHRQAEIENDNIEPILKTAALTRSVREIAPLHKRVLFLIKFIGN